MKKSPTGSINVVISHDHVALIDEICAAIRRNTGQAVNRSAMIRAIAGAVLPLYPDWLRCSSEDEIRQKISMRLGPPQRKPAA